MIWVRPWTTNNHCRNATSWAPCGSSGLGSADFATTWTSNMDECEWLDVECEDNGRVTYLNMWSENVRGPIPADLGLLTDLTYLDLSSNLLTGTIPSSLGALTAMTRLALSRNQISRTIPSSLGALRALSSLYLHNNQLVGTMPFCISGQSFESLVADCMEVNCTCCTRCCPDESGDILASLLCEY
jgi:hypothetical protein